MKVRQKNNIILTGGNSVADEKANPIRLAKKQGRVNTIVNLHRKNAFRRFLSSSMIITGFREFLEQKYQNFGTLEKLGRPSETSIAAKENLSQIA